MWFFSNLAHCGVSFTLCIYERQTYREDITGASRIVTHQEACIMTTEDMFTCEILLHQFWNRLHPFLVNQKIVLVLLSDVIILAGVMVNNTCTVQHMRNTEDSIVSSNPVYSNRY